MTTPTQLAVVELLREVTGEDAEWLAGLGPATRLDGDLFLDSLELAALSERLAARFGPGVDLAGHIAGLELEALLGLSVADVSSYVDSTRGTP
ncbi:phosphopantetheine-binding protein [Dactylosporangium sp. CA-233914]|uniref:phosphopantetheine-binding protein n=1 Tax=Dactylosporangium sp. CA-233914 TaxID=3239934 RepID=UPI003D9165F1